jgi:hypothetical protein
VLAEAISATGGSDAVALRVAEQYLDAFSQLAKQSTTLLLPAATSEPASMVAQALSIYGSVLATRGGGDGGGGSGGVAAAPTATAAGGRSRCDLPAACLGAPLVGGGCGGERYALY